MYEAVVNETARRYQDVASEKSSGATYTPAAFARFVAKRIVENALLSTKTQLSILDPAIGDGELILGLLSELSVVGKFEITVTGFDTDPAALKVASRRITQAFPSVVLSFNERNFLEFVLEHDSDASAPLLFSAGAEAKFDLIIANPPYVRTQIMGSEQAQALGESFGLAGRVDLYQAFLLGIARVLRPNGTAGMIISNRFMTTKGGGVLRSALRKQFWLKQVWDLGDTKLFDAAVLPAVIVACGNDGRIDGDVAFTSIYETKDSETGKASDVIAALSLDGVIEVEDGRRFHVKHGKLDSSGDQFDIWRIATDSGDNWTATVKNHTWARFGEIGKIRVGVKTCADKVFIRHDWDSEFGNEKPELLRPLTTHHGAGRYRAIPAKKPRQIVYPHEVANGRRQATDINKYPRTKRYLESHRSTLEGRSYVMEAGRQWYEIWVPQDPEAWSAPKLVFRDISERPTFWIDLDGSIVNGDCYWLVATGPNRTDLLWLAVAVANSTFAEAFYDHCFNNKLYAGRRRFITQYVEQFPLPNPESFLSQEIIARAKAIYESDHSANVIGMEIAIDKLVWEAFGLSTEEVSR